MKAKQVSGSISVFLAFTITFILSFCMVLIESARENTMLLKADMVFDTGIRCLMAEYHSKLWETYDLFYVDCSYGTGNYDYENIESHLQYYIKENLKYDAKDWLSMAYEDSKITDVVLATDKKGTDFYLQAIKVAETSMGISYVEQALKWLEQIESTQYIDEYVIQQRKETKDALESVNGMTIEVKEAVWGKNAKGEVILLEEAEYETVQINNPFDDILSGNILFRQIVSDMNVVSECQVDISTLASNRMLAEGTASHLQLEDTDGLWKKALFCKYLLDHFESYRDCAENNKTDAEDEKSNLKYPLEYLIGGKSADTQNMELVAMKLLAIRLIDNYLWLLQDEMKRAEADAIGAASATLVPWVAPIISQATLIFWAYESSIEDLKKLFRGETIPLVKAVKADVLEQVLLDYEDYVCLLLFMQNKEELIMRAMDMIELSVREEQSNFQMDGCISYAVFSGSFTDIYKKQYTIIDRLQY